MHLKYRSQFRAEWAIIFKNFYETIILNFQGEAMLFLKFYSSEKNVYKLF